MSAAGNVGHESQCVLTPNHYGPCAPAEFELYVADEDNKVLWRQPLAPSPGYSKDPDSEYMRVWRPAYERATDECVEAAFRLGFLPMRRYHSRHTEVLEWPIEVCEIEEYGDLELTLPMGRFRLKARRARKGEMTNEIGVGYSFVVLGFKVAAEDTNSPPVRLRGRVLKWEYVESGYVVQPSEIEYADGTRSGYLGSYPLDLDRIAEGADTRAAEYHVAGE